MADVTQHPEPHGYTKPPAGFPPNPTVQIAAPAAAIAYAELWQRQQAFSERVWGTERGPVGPLRHLLRELHEVAQAAPEALPLECADVLILAIEAARRAGFGVTASQMVKPSPVPRPPKFVPADVLITEAAQMALEHALRGEHRTWVYATLVAAAYDLGASHGLSHADLTACALAKTCINERRRWSPPDADGVSEHVRTAVAKAVDEGERRPNVVARGASDFGLPGADAGEPDQMPARTFSNRFGWVPR